MVLKSRGRIFALTVLATSSGLWAYAGTGGTPIGGMGAGYVVFNAVTGQFAAVTKFTPAGSVAASEFTSWESKSCGFHFYVNNGGTITAKQKDTTHQEDAKIPAYYATYAPLGGVTFSLTGFGPYIPGDAALYAQFAQSPLAFYDIAVTNTNATAVDAAASFEFANSTTGGTNLLGGSNTGMSDTSGGNANLNTAVAFDSTKDSLGHAYIMVGGDQATDTFTSGSIGSFLTTGKLTTGAGNLVAGKVHVAAGAIVHFRFVIAWWSRWAYSGTATTKPGAEDHYYQNYYTNAKQAATLGMTDFAQVEGGATSIVNRVMASNFPYWYRDRLLNNLYPMIHNSDCSKDGRVGFWEGEYAIIGTIDQTEHAALWYSFNWPSVSWRELKFWATQQHVASEGNNLLGQIHHDFNGCTAEEWANNNTDIQHFMYPWNNTTHADYWYEPNTTNWEDINCMFVFKAYELMLATGRKDSLAAYWDSLKNTATRMAYHSSTAGGGNGALPTTAYSTYDGTGSDKNYCSSTDLAAWESLIAMATWLGDTASVTKYTGLYNTAKASFPATCFTASFGTGLSYSEGDVAGYSWTHYFCLPAFMDTGECNTANQRLWAYYNAQSGTRNKLGLYHFYTYDHWGGFATAIGKPNMAMVIHNWDWTYYYPGNPGYIFWQILQSGNSSYASYSTAPDVWRSYFQFTGTLVDNANQRLWIRPSIPDSSIDSMAHVLKNCPIINPHGWGTLNYTDSTVGTRVQNLTVSFDSALTFTQIVLKNNTSVASPGVSVTNNGAALTSFTVTTDSLASPFERVIRLTFSPAITIQQGATIKVFNGAVGIKNAVGALMHQEVLGIGSAVLAAGSPIHYSLGSAGLVKMELFSINGARIGTIMNGYAAAGSHTYVWNGKTAQGAGIGAEVAVLRLSAAGKSVSKIVSISK